MFLINPQLLGITEAPSVGWQARRTGWSGCGELLKGYLTWGLNVHRLSVMERKRSVSFACHKSLRFGNVIG